jgi:cytochrome c oxidase cbb3-type subunit I/II
MSNFIKSLETKVSVLLIIVGALFFLGTYFTLIVPLVDDELYKASNKFKDYNDREKKGRAVFIAEGCTYCHTVQVRHLLFETKRYGMSEEETYKKFGIRTLIQAPPSEPGEYVTDFPHLLGTRRVGPDLGRVGGKYDNTWHINHLRDPRTTTPGSIMPAYSWLFDKQGKPKEDAINLVAFLQKLGNNVDWRTQGVEQAKKLLELKNKEGSNPAAKEFSF